MTIKTKFERIQQALENIAKELITENKIKSVGIAEFARPPLFPAVLVWIRRGESKDVKVAGTEKLHVWRFEYVILTRAGTSREAYDSAMDIMFTLYEKIINNRTLGITDFSVEATPAPTFERYESEGQGGQYAHIVVMAIDVRVEG